MGRLVIVRTTEAQNLEEVRVEVGTLEEGVPVVDTKDLIEEVVVASVEVAAVIAVVSEEAVVASVEVAAVTVEASEEAVVVSEEAVEEVEINYYFNFYTYFFIFKKIRRSSWWSIP
jgi:hypothetical protein